jgi:hypothetical protein
MNDADGKPIGLTPHVLLVPPALRAVATAWATGAEWRDTTASTKAPTANPFNGAFPGGVVTSPYMSNTAYTGASTTSWYILANPADLATMSVVFVGGQETPIVEQAELDAATLGISIRGYMDFGCAQHDYRAGVRANQ